MNNISWKSESRRVLWLSRHEPTAEQRDGLLAAIRKEAVTVERLDIVQVSKTVSSGAEVWGLCKENNCRYIVAVLPPKELSELMTAAYAECGPIVATLVYVPRSKRLLDGDKVQFVYDGYDVVVRCEYSAVRVGV